MNPSVCLSQLPAAICLLSFQPRPPSSKRIIPALPPWFVLPSSVSLPLLPLIRAACIASAKSLLPSNRPQRAGPGGLCRPSSAYHVLLRSFQCPRCLLVVPNLEPVPFPFSPGHLLQSSFHPSCHAHEGEQPAQACCSSTYRRKFRGAVIHGPATCRSFWASAQRRNLTGYRIPG